METIWREIHAELTKISTEIGASFNDGATENQISELEKMLGKSLPEDFKDYLRLFNGQNDENILFLGYNSLLSVEKMIEFYQMKMDLFADEEPIDWIKLNKIQPMIWDKGWLPFSDFEASSQLIIDLNPAENGSFGQVIKMWSGIDYQSDEIVIAKDFSEFSREILRLLKEKNYTFENDVIEQDYFV